MNKNRLVFAFTSMLGVAAAGWVAVKYQTQKRKLLRQLLHSSQVAETPSGPIEYAIDNKGPAVLIIHGGPGGYDQGMYLARLLDDGYTFIAPSRFGYLRTPLRDDNSPEAQADAYAALLDALDIQKTIIIGLSAGGPSSIQFALRHPDRCQGLVLLSAVNQPFPQTTASVFRTLGHIERISPDFIVWAVVKATDLNGLFLLDQWTPETLDLVKLDPTKGDLLRQFIQTALPGSMRWPGLLNDLEQISQLTLSLAEVKIPTLVIHGSLDQMAPYAQGQCAANHVPNAHLLTVEGGNHFIHATHTEQLVSTIREFLASYSTR